MCVAHRGRQLVGQKPPAPRGCAEDRAHDEEQHGKSYHGADGERNPDERVLADRVGHVPLRDVDPVLLRQLDEDPEHDRGREPEASRHARGVEAESDHLVRDEEVLERVREDQQHRTRGEQFEEDDAEEPVVEEELRDPERRVTRPVPHRREVGDREVVDVERLVPALVGAVGGQVDLGELREQRVVDAVERERDDDHEREARDQQRHEEPRCDDRNDDRGVVGGEGGDEVRHDQRPRLTGSGSSSAIASRRSPRPAGGRTSRSGRGARQRSQIRAPCRPR